MFQSMDPGAGNVVVVLDEGEAVVVDSSPSPVHVSGVVDALIELGVTKLRAIVNTHWHADHVLGNQSFVEAFPGVPILSHPTTLRDIQDDVIPDIPGQIERLRAILSERDRMLARGVGPDGRVSERRDAKHPARPAKPPSVTSSLDWKVSSPRFLRSLWRTQCGFT